MKARKLSNNQRMPGFLPAGAAACLCLVMFSAALFGQGPSKSMPLDQMIQALGGEAFMGVQDIHTTGRYYGFTRGELSAADYFSDYIKFPDMERTEFGTTKNKSITINRGTQGAKVEGKKDPEQQTPGEGEEFLKGFKTSLDYVLRFVVKEKQTTIQTLPPEIVDFKRADVVELRDSAKNRIRFYIDRTTHLPMKLQVRRADESKIREEQYANWHKFQDVMTPLFVSRYTDGLKTIEIRAENAVYNSNLPDTLFTQMNQPK